MKDSKCEAYTIYKMSFKNVPHTMLIALSFTEHISISVTNLDLPSNLPAQFYLPLLGFHSLHGLSED